MAYHCLPGFNGDVISSCCSNSDHCKTFEILFIFSISQNNVNSKIHFKKMFGKTSKSELSLVCFS